MTFTFWFEERHGGGDTTPLQVRAECPGYAMRKTHDTVTGYVEVVVRARYRGCAHELTHAAVSGFVYHSVRAFEKGCADREAHARPAGVRSFLDACKEEGMRGARDLGVSAGIRRFVASCSRNGVRTILETCTEDRGTWDGRRTTLGRDSLTRWFLQPRWGTQYRLKPAVGTGYVQSLRGMPGLGIRSGVDTCDRFGLRG